MRSMLIISSATPSVSPTWSETTFVRIRSLTFMDASPELALSLTVRLEQNLCRAKISKLSLIPPKVLKNRKKRWDFSYEQEAYRRSAHKVTPPRTQYGCTKP